MPLQCPRCQNTIVLEGDPPGEVVCPSCGSSIQLAPGATTGWLPDHAPKRLGKFELLEQLGIGAFGTVYKARDTELGRLVALKVPRSGSGPKAEDMDRFLREARSAATLQHPGIVSLYDAGPIDGTCCLVSEFIQGATLAERLSAKRFGFRQAAELIAEVAGALHYAHQHGVVHRDIKPSNIMLDLEGRPHLMDFGLAKRAADEITVTVEGQVLGTPAYMPPEQARGEVGNVDARSDLYSLGVILFELLTGELPFRGQTRMLLVQVIQDEPRPPRRLNDAVPRDLETVCLKAMAKSPAQRYQSGGELAEDLRRFLKGEPIRARPVGPVGRLRRWCRRSPGIAALTGAVAFLLLAITLASVGISLYLHALHGDLRAETQKAKTKAEEANREADAAWANQYAAHMNLLQSDWEIANISRILDTLEVYRKPPPAGREDPRGWEWHYQESLCQRQPRTLTGHTRALWGVAFSPDGAQLASACDDGTVKLWDAASGRELHTLKGHAGWVESVAFSPDGKRLASAGQDKTVRLWDVTLGRQLDTLDVHENRAHGVAFSPGGARLASAYQDGTVKLWDAASGRLLHTLKGHRDQVDCVAFSPDGKRLASAGQDKTVRLWDVTLGRQLDTLEGHTEAVHGVAFTPDGARLASGSWDGTVRLWDAASGRELRTLTGHTSRVDSVAFSPDGARLASASDDRTLRLWDAASGRALRILKGHTEAVHSVAFSPDGAWLASAGHDRTVRLWDAASGQGSRAFIGNRHKVNSVAFSPDGKRLASGSEDGTFALWDAVTGQQLRTQQGHTKALWGVAFSPDGKRLASASGDKTVKVWDAVSGRELLALNRHDNGVLCVAFSPDGKRLASGSWDKTVKVWDAASGRELHTIKDHTGVVRSVAFSPDGARLASGSWDKTVKVWDAASGQLLCNLGGHTTRVLSVAFSPDGARVASASYDGTVKLWGAASGQPLRSFNGHIGEVYSVAFSPDGGRLASAGRDRTVKLWGAASRQELRTLEGHTGVVREVAFSPDGHWLASASEDGAVRLWDARPVTPDIKAEVEAVGLLDFLFSWPLPSSEVRAALRRDKLLSDAARNKALEFVERFKEVTDPKQYHAAAWPVIRHPYANDFVCQLALAQMRAACELAPDNATYRLALGVAQYRLGKFHKERYAEALTTLTRCDQAHPTTLAFLALVRHRLGQKDQARATLARLREAIHDPPWSANEQAKAFLREAAELIEGRPKP